MRWLLALLVLANLFAFALFNGWLSPWIRTDREPQRLVEQRNAERIRVVPLERLGGAAGPSPPAQPSLQEGRTDVPGANRVHERAGASRIEGTVADASAVPGAAAAARAAVCVAFGPLDEQRSARLREALESAGASVDAVRIEQAASYLVYLSPSGTPAEAQRRLGEVRRLGQADAFVIQDGPLRLGVSIGLFRSEEMAQSLVTRLEQLGETGARIAPRGAVTVRVRLLARWTDAAAASAAATIAARFDAPTRDCS